MIFDYEPGDRVVNPDRKDWGIGQVQTIINEKVTVNFENIGKIVINANKIVLEKLINEWNKFKKYLLWSYRYFFTRRQKESWIKRSLT